MRRAKKKSLFLIGFMASGKTTLGRILSERLDLPFADTDALVELASGRRIPRLIAEEGEEKFRMMEERALAKAAGRCGRVVAVGGGAVMRTANRAVMRRAGIVCYLDASLAVLLDRFERQGLARRPLWRGRRRRQRLAEARSLLALRRPLYRRAADFTVRSDRGSPRNVARRILTRLRAHI